MNKRNKKQTKKRKYSKKQHGGLLVVSETDLNNTHICPKKEKDKPKDTIGEELYTYNGEIFQLNIHTLGYLQQMYKKSDDKWFKFVIFNNDETKYIYIIQGGRINKHSVCMLVGLLDVTKQSGEYAQLREAVKELLLFKLHNEVLIVNSNEELTQQLHMLIERVNELVLRDINCMPVIAAGSGTINDDDDNIICINDKSGHYKPTVETMEISQRIFREVTGAEVIVTEKVDKLILKEKYGEAYENYSGICL